MFDSEIKTQALINLIKSEVDVAYQIPDESYISWITSLEQLLYSEVIREYGLATENITAPDVLTTIDFSSVTVPSGQNPMRFEDIHAVYINSTAPQIYSGIGIELTKTTPASGRVFNNVYFKLGNDLYCKSAQSISSVIMVYFVRPTTKTLATASSANINVPLEFIDLVKAKLRAEAYKLMNEDSVAAKWLADYNALLETFKMWVTQRVPNFGV